MRSEEGRKCPCDVGSGEFSSYVSMDETEKALAYCRSGPYVPERGVEDVVMSRFELPKLACLRYRERVGKT